MLPASQRLTYCAYDLHRAAKRRDVDVLAEMQPLMQKVVGDVGAFVYVPPVPKVRACTGMQCVQRWEHT